MSVRRDGLEIKPLFVVWWLIFHVVNKFGKKKMCEKPEGEIIRQAFLEEMTSRMMALRNDFDPKLCTKAVW